MSGYCQDAVPAPTHPVRFVFVEFYGAKKPASVGMGAMPVLKLAKTSVVYTNFGGHSFPTYPSLSAI